MKLRHLFLIAGSLAIAFGQVPAKTIVTNLETANWTQEKGYPAGSEGVMLRADSANGGMDLLVRFPAGHVIAPHSHESNERIIIVEGQLTLSHESGNTLLNAGGYAFLPAHEIQRIACTSKTRCTFYISWDGKPNSHPEK